MKKYGKWLLGALALLCAFGLGRSDLAYTEAELAVARDQAYSDGYYAGLAEGESTGQDGLYDEAFAEGKQQGYDEGYSLGQTQGQEAALSAVGDTYQQGYDTGYADGYGQVQKDGEAAREKYLASVTPATVTPSTLPASTDTPEADDPEETEPAGSNAPTEPAGSAGSDGQLVYVTKSGSKYHTADCSHLSKSKIAKTLSEARASGYEPCKSCKPPQ